MLRVLIYTSVVGSLMLGLTGCERVGEPWDKSDYFAVERTARSAEQQKGLRDRLSHTQAERERGLHQTF